MLVRTGGYEDVLLRMGQIILARLGSGAQRLLSLADEVQRLGSLYFWPTADGRRPTADGGRATTNLDQTRLD